MFRDNRDSLTWNIIRGTNYNQDNITGNLISPLPIRGDNGAVISWNAEPTGYINTTTGEITRPGSREGDKIVNLTAEITKGLESQSKVFLITIKASASSSGGDASDHGDDQCHLVKLMTNYNCN